MVPSTHGDFGVLPIVKICGLILIDSIMQLVNNLFLKRSVHSPAIKVPRISSRALAYNSGWRARSIIAFDNANAVFSELV